MTFIARNTFVVLAALDPAGPFPAICGITWTLLCPTSVITALTSGVLCLFQRTSRQAFRLSRIGLWTGSIAFLAAVAGTTMTAGYNKDAPEPMGEAMLMIFLTGIAPVFAYFTGRFSRQKIMKLESKVSSH